jgi:Baseplate J-like protein
MSNCNSIVSVLTKNGVDQKQRYIDALQPEKIQLHQFEIADWILFAYHFAQHVNYFKTSNDTIPESDWKSFFDFFELKDKTPNYTKPFELNRIKDNVNKLIDEAKKENALTPHLTLFITFLHLLENSKKRLNNLTKRHLDFYLEEIVQIDKLPATPDKVYMIFELAKNATQQKIEAKTKFDGGKDASGKTKTYSTTEELIANKTTIGTLKNVYHDAVNKKIVASPVANSYDGQGKAFPDENNQWWPFGHTNDANNPNELPFATLGFAVAAPVLLLKEGIRSIEFAFTFEDDITDITADQITQNTIVNLTTAKKWHEQNPIATASGYATTVTGKTMKIALQLDENTDAITNYNPKVYGDEFNIELPIAKFIFKTEEENGYELYKSLAQNKLISIAINVDVQNIKTLQIENDASILNASKPFYPFTTIPMEGSNFYFKHEESLGKNWETLNATIIWKNTPDNFNTHYAAYLDTFKTKISIGDYTGSFDGSGVPISDKPQIITNDAHFKYDLAILTNNTWDTINSSESTLFSTESNPFSTAFSVENDNYSTEKNGQFRLTLKTSFLHDLYPKIYAIALAAGKDAKIVPNEPYTPLAESIILSYTASETINFSEDIDSTIEEVYSANTGKLFHIHPFGYSEEHSFLKSELEYVKPTDSHLTPTYCIGGELFIGLENTAELEQVTLLFQVLEGSENPTEPSFVGKQKIEWLILGNNEWKTLEYEDILLNETDNLLQSGIFKFNVPKEATKDNTTLPKNYVWLKAKMHKKYDVVCKIIGIHTQVVKATFEDNSNDLTHLKTGIEAKTISKLIERISTVKSVAQPYSSFDYKPVESDEDYYRRTSERFRHKNRAITMWDYEHIILQEFPELYKVKCLNHTSETSYQAPGNVTLVVIPDTVKKNVFDIYEPRVSTATLNKVKNFVSKLNSMHVNTFVINPNYEKVKVELEVEFKSGFDVNFYSQQLNTDITKFLSPWAFDTQIPINFGVSIHISSVIKYIEELDYVDFLQDVRLLKDDSLSDKIVAPSDPKSILVSAKEHRIGTDIKKCTTTTPEQKEECQM